MLIDIRFNAPPIFSELGARLSLDKARQKLREKLRDPLYLPTHKDIALVFKPGRRFSQEWHDFCYSQENPIFEFLNEEYVSALSDYLAQRAKLLGASKDSPLVVLEVGAGNGRLSHFLREKLEKNLPGQVMVIATDSDQWGFKHVFPVETMDHKNAVERYKPRIVISAWMPIHVDFTHDFRAAKSVEEYILIGPAEGGCGDMWRTWGKRATFDENREGKEDVAPYIADGFEREDLEDIRDHQICRMDEPQNYFHSSTVSFKRRKNLDKRV